MAVVYILHSSIADKFYIGFTNLSAEERLNRHLNHYYKKSFTSKYSDWTLFLEIFCHSDSQARKIEKHIKKMKSKHYLRNLVAFPEISQKLLEKYCV